MVFESGKKSSRKAFIGANLDDAKRRQIANEMNPLTGRDGNSITAEEVSDLRVTKPQKYKDLRRMPDNSALSFYAVGLCQEHCTREFPGHVSHAEHASTPYFARRSDGGLCQLGACTSDYNPADERDENEPRRRVAATREKIQLVEDNGQLTIDWHRVNVVSWPNGVEDKHKQEAKDYLRGEVNELQDGSNYLEFDNPLLNSRRINIDWQTDVDDYWINLYRFDNKMRYFFGECVPINNTQSRWKMEEVKPSGVSNEKEITIKTGESALIWIPSLPAHNNDPADSWHDRVHQDVREWVDGFKDKWAQYCSIEPCVHHNYPGVFIAIYGTTDLGPKRALLSQNYNINELRSIIDERHHGQPFIDFREETKGLKFFWPGSQTSPYGLTSDNGSLVRIQSVNGQIDMLIMANRRNDGEGSGGWEIGLIEPNDSRHNFESKGRRDCFGNIWVSLRFRRTGEHVFVVMQGSVKRHLLIDVPDVPNGNQLRVHLDNKGWSELSEAGWIDSPDLQLKQDIINSNEDEILCGLDFDRQPYNGLAPDECYIGLVQDIARSVFQQFKDQGTSDSIATSVFSRKIREVCYLLHMAIWPDEEIESTIPSLGLLMKRMAEFEYSSRDDENTSWRWSNREMCAQSIPDFDEWCILYDHRPDAMVKEEYGPDSISVDLKTGIRFIKKEVVDNSGIAVIQNRPDLDRIAPTSGEWLVKIWEGASEDSIDLPAGDEWDEVIFRWSGADDSSPRVMSRESIKDVINRFDIDWYDDLEIVGNSWVRKKQFSSAVVVEIPSGKLFLQLTVNKKGRDENGDRRWRLHLGHYSIESGEPRERCILIATENSHSDTTRIGWISPLGIVGQGSNQLDLGFLKYPWSSHYLDKAYLIRETCRAFVTMSGAKLENFQSKIGIPGFINVYPRQSEEFGCIYPQTIVEALENQFGLDKSNSEVVISKMKEGLLGSLWW